MSRRGVMGRPRADDRRCLNAILYVLITGCRWNDLPKEYGYDSTAWRRLNRWAWDGTLLRLWRHLLRDLDIGGQLDWKRCAVDGSYVKAQKEATLTLSLAQKRESGHFHPASAKIEGDKVTVSSSDVKAPTIVRYGWAEYPTMSLYNSAGLPAPPFVREVGNTHAEVDAINAPSLLKSP